MTKRKAQRLPKISRKRVFVPAWQYGSYCARVTEADRLLGSAEVAVRKAASFWVAVDDGLYERLRLLAEMVLVFRRSSAEIVDQKYGDRLSDDPVDLKQRAFREDLAAIASIEGRH